MCMHLGILREGGIKWYLSGVLRVASVCVHDYGDGRERIKVVSKW